MVEAKVLHLVHDFQCLSKSVTEQIDSHKTWLQELEVKMMSKLNEHMSKDTNKDADFKLNWKRVAITGVFCVDADFKLVSSTVISSGTSSNYESI
ncbi:hypothetical protein YC2023_031381 [Brassica napus]